MGLQLISIAVGTAVGAAAAYVMTNRELRSRIDDGSLQLERTVTAYFTGESADDEQTKSATAEAQQQEQPADQQRCQAMTKAGKR